MLEQVVRKTDNANDRFWKKIFRIIQVISLVFLGIGISFGFTVNSYYWNIDRAVFWQSCFYLLTMALPLVAFVAILQGMIYKLGLEYDYEYTGTGIRIFRLLGNSRKHYLSFELTSISYFKDVVSIRPGSADEKLLRSAKAASCNPDAPHLVLIRTDECLLRGKPRQVYVLLELNDVFYETLCRKLHIFNYKSQNEMGPHE